MEHNSPYMSIVIPVFGFRPELAKCLNALFTQENLGNVIGEILICHQGPSLENVTIVVNNIRTLHHSNLVKIVSVPKPLSLTHTRNYGVAISKFAVLLFLDDDTVVEDGLLAELTKFYTTHGDAGAVGVNVLSVDSRTLYLPYLALAKLFGLTQPTKNECNFLPTTENTFAFPLTRAIFANWLSGCAFSVRRDNCLKIRFDENLQRYSFKEDMDFSFRLKRYLKTVQQEVYLDPNAKVTHLQAEGFRITGVAMHILKEEYTWYLFFKDIYYAENSITKQMYYLAFFLWSRIGRIAVKTLEAIRYGEPQILLLSVKASLIALCDLSKIAALDVSHVSKWL